MTICKGNRYYTVSDLARELGVKLTTLWAQIYIQERVQEPFAQVGRKRKRYYTEEAYQEIIRQHRQEEGKVAGRGAVC